MKEVNRIFFFFFTISHYSRRLIRVIRRELWQYRDQHFTAEVSLKRARSVGFTKDHSTWLAGSRKLLSKLSQVNSFNFLCQSIYIMFKYFFLMTNDKVERIEVSAGVNGLRALIKYNHYRSRISLSSIAAGRRGLTISWTGSWKYSIIGCSMPRQSMPVTCVREFIERAQS